MKTTKVIPYGKQLITDEDIDAVTKALKGEYLTQGPTIRCFEEEFAKYIGVKYALAVSNGTAALHLSALALGVDETSNVITTPITFAASANCIKYCGGNVYFADIDAQTYLLDINKVEELINSKPPGFFKGIIPVDFSGRAVNMEAFKIIADKYSLWLIEDACHAPGGFFTDCANQHQYCGNGQFADLSVFSFHPVKHIACGEGGMITTNNERLFKKLLMLRTHGITRDPENFTNPIAMAAGIKVLDHESLSSYPGWYMEMKDLGYNYRLTDIQAALGLSQLKRADQGLIRRRQIAKQYNEMFKEKKWLYGQSGCVEGHAYHLYLIEVDDRLGLYNYLKAHGIYAQVHYIPTHLMPYYRSMGYKMGDFSIAETYYSRCLSLPMYPSLSDSEQEFVISTVINFYND